MTSRAPEATNRGDALRSFLMGARVAAIVSLGVRLGLYDVMKDAGPLTGDDLASRKEYNERWVLEWLRGQAASRIVVNTAHRARSLGRRCSADSISPPVSPCSSVLAGRTVWVRACCGC